ncbi:MAG: FecR family protein, partial [Gammaproteobacteria bacterium]
MIRSLANLARILLLATMLATPALAIASAGVVSFVAGEAYRVETDGSKYRLSKGMAIEDGDRIQTGPSGRVELLMSDGGLIALRPRSDFLVESFVYTVPEGATAGDSPESKKDRSFFSLIKGGLRSVTGAVGESDKEAYRMNTPVATIGIRGTDYLALFCAAVCGHDGQLPKGLHVFVVSGAIRVDNPAGSISVLPGETGYVKDRGSAPIAGVAPALLLDEFDWPVPPDDLPETAYGPLQEDNADTSDSGSRSAALPTSESSSNATTASAAVFPAVDKTPTVTAAATRSASSGGTAQTPAGLFAGEAAPPRVMPGTTTTAPGDGTPAGPMNGNPDSPASPNVVARVTGSVRLAAPDQGSLSEDFQETIGLGTAIIGPNGDRIELTSGSARLPIDGDGNLAGTPVSDADTVSEGSSVGDAYADVGGTTGGTTGG